MVDAAFNLALKNQADQKLLNLLVVDVELLSKYFVKLMQLEQRKLQTLARNVSSNRVYGLIRSIKYCVRRLRRSSPMYCLMNGSSMIVDLFSVGVLLKGTV